MCTNGVARVRAVACVCGGKKKRKLVLVYLLPVKHRLLAVGVVATATTGILVCVLAAATATLGFTDKVIARFASVLAVQGRQ